MGTCTGFLPQQIPRAGTVSMERSGWPGRFLGHGQECPSLLRIPISQSHRIRWGGKALWDHWVQSVTKHQCQLHPGTECHGRSFLKHPQGRWLHQFPGQCIPMSDHPFCEEILHYVQPEPSLVHLIYALFGIWIAPGVKLFQDFAGCVWHGRAQLRGWGPGPPPGAPLHRLTEQLSRCCAGSQRPELPRHTMENCEV